jgi:hypothetical protein
MVLEADDEVIGFEHCEQFERRRGFTQPRP